MIKLVHDYYNLSHPFHGSRRNLQNPPFTKSTITISESSWYKNESRWLFLPAVVRPRDPILESMYSLNRKVYNVKKKYFWNRKITNISQE